MPFILHNSTFFCCLSGLAWLLYAVVVSISAFLLEVAFLSEQETNRNSPKSTKDSFLKFGLIFRCYSLSYVGVRKWFELNKGCPLTNEICQVCFQTHWLNIRILTYRIQYAIPFFICLSFNPHRSM